MRIFAAILVLLWLPIGACAQSDDEGRIVRFIEDALSDGAARQVDLQGFRGALSAQASLDRLTVSDDQGVWLEIEGAVLDWNRAAVLRGRIAITALTADFVRVSRPPITENAPPAPEATAFALPDLPISIEIALAEIGRLELGAPILGEAVAATANVSLSLAGGAGEVSLDITRLDGPMGNISLEASYDNATQVAAIDLSVTEAADGLAVNLLGIEGAPSAALRVAGEGPFDAFAAEFALITEGVDRLSGTATSARRDTGDIGYDFEMSGDLSPIVSGDLETFLGPDAEITARATRASSGALSLDDLTVRAAAVSLDGDLELDAQGQPVRFDLSGRLLPPEGQSVLTLPGGAADIDGATLALTYDSRSGDTVAGAVDLDGLRSRGLSAPATQLLLDGTIGRDGANITGFAGSLAIEVAGLTHQDPAIAAALGNRVTLGLQANWAPETGIFADDINLRSATARLTGRFAAMPGDGRLDLDAEIRLNAADLSPFGLLIDQPLAGRAEAEIELAAELLSGAFETRFEAETRSLRVIGLIPNELLSGQTRLSGRLQRDAAGLELDGLSLVGTALSLEAEGQLSTERARLEFNAALSDAALADPRLAGPVRLSGLATRDGGGTAYVLPDLEIETDYGALVAEITAAPDAADFPISATIDLNLPDLSRLSALAGQTLGGGLSAELHADAEVVSRQFSSRFEATGRDLRLSDAVPSALFDGQTVLAGQIAGTADHVTIDTLTLSGQEVSAEISGRTGRSETNLSVSANLRDAEIFTQTIPGAVAIQADITQVDSGPFAFDAELIGPIGLRADLSGTATRELALDAVASGVLPLALANPLLAPQTLSGLASFDLNIRGPADLGALAGQISVSDARLGVPSRNVSLENMSARADIRGGSADIVMNAALNTGGSVAVSGRVGLAQPGLPGSLSIEMANGRVVDPELFEAAIDAALTFTGALAGASNLVGQVDFGTVEIRVPESNLGAAGEIPEIRHVGETAAERQTRANAGLLDASSGPSGSSAIGLDIGLSAPGQIFLRGRGIDAEMGGTLRLGGTAADVIASGSFELIRGRLSILGQRLDLREGSVTLRGGDPYLSLAAETQSGEYTITIVLEGPASAPVVSFTSAPDLPEDEVLAQLFFGRSLSNLSALQALQLADGVASLTGGGSGILTRLREGLGLDNFDLQTDDEGNAIVSAGRYLSENIYTNFTVDEDGTGVTLNIDLTPSITARGGVSSSGESGIGVFFERDY
ncbi:MAG: translocation/assembly module TamB domain-containing protein [Pseudomonadota bacterium]